MKNLIFAIFILLVQPMFCQVFTSEQKEYCIETFTEWSKRDDEYSYSIMWGNGLSAPKGESEEDDGMFSLSFKKGSKIINLSHGSW